MLISFNNVCAYLIIAVTVAGQYWMAILKVLRKSAHLDPSNSIMRNCDESHILPKSRLVYVFVIQNDIFTCFSTKTFLGFID